MPTTFAHSTNQQTSQQRRVMTIDNKFGCFAVLQDNVGTLTSRWLGEHDWDDAWIHDAALLPDLQRELSDYFAGNTRVEFASTPTPDGPPFFQRCWEACRAIPRGKTLTYADLAEAAGNRAAARAAGGAMRNNPLPIIVPCHRVIGSDGDLHGFAGSTESNGQALGLKANLLKLEGATFKS